MRPNFYAHLHPPTIPERQARFAHTLGAGGLAVFLGGVLLITGILEMFYYVPAVEQAAESVQTITYLVPYGGLIRNLHYWSAQILIVVSLVHLLRVVFTGAYSPPRRTNYLIGLGLLVMVVFMDFTGLVLRWDEGIYWALITGTNLLRTIPVAGEAVYRLLVGGAQPGAATLIRFYAWHIFGLTLAGVVLGVWHIFRVRRDGGIAAPPSAIRHGERRIARRVLIEREVLAMLLAGAGLFIVAVLFPAPIAQPLGNAAGTPAETRAPWFFLWVQELLRFGDPFSLGVLLPFLLLVVLGALPFVFSPVDEKEIGKWFPRSGRAVSLIVGVIFAALLFLTMAMLLDPVV